MNYILSLLLTFIFYFFLQFPVQAEWVKSSQNPIIKATPNTWYSIHAGSPSVIYDNGLFKMWFHGHNGSNFSIGYAESLDGIHWSILSQPVITISSPGLTNGKDVNEPMVIKNGNIFQMWFKEYIIEENRIRYATSTDGITWDINPQPVFINSSLSWELYGPTNPAIIFENNEYKMWYISAGQGSPWQMGYATSHDGITWTRFENNPLKIPNLGLIGGPTIIKFNEVFHMWYHTSNGTSDFIYHVISIDGINWACEGPCTVLQTTNNSFDSNGMITPSVIQYNNSLYLWYTGSNGPNWQIGLATFDFPVTPTPMNTPTPTIIPTPTSTPTPFISPTLLPSPTPTIKIPIVIIPGFMASWNKDAILHNQTVSQSSWKIPSYIKDYDAIIKTLKNIGYVEHKDIYFFTYDWRKNLNTIAEDLNDYINKLTTSNGEPISHFNIVGHSLGGLVGRIWLQKYNANNVDLLITIGTPHKGTAQVYKAVEAGELDKSNSFLWLAEKTILMLNKNGIESDKQTLNNIFPVLKDLLPTYPYLKKQDYFIPPENMHIQNNVLSEYNTNLQRFFPYLYSFSGDKDNTLFGFKVNQSYKSNFPLNNYLDGNPVDEIHSIGDSIITRSSAIIGNNNKTLHFNHGELIYKKDAIREILEVLKINYSDNQIIEGKPTIISPSLLFFIKSPAEMQVTYNDTLYKEDEGMIFIPDASSGKYKIEITGNDNGIYTFISGQIGTEKDNWTSLTKSIQRDQIDTYNLDFNSKDPKHKISFEFSKFYKWYEKIMRFFEKKYK